MPNKYIYDLMIVRCTSYFTYSTIFKNSTLCFGAQEYGNSVYGIEIISLTLRKTARSVTVLFVNAAYLWS